MPVLQYDLAVVGVDKVERALSSIEKRFMAHNARLTAVSRSAPGGSRATGAGGPDRELRSIARASEQLDRQRSSALMAQYRQRERLEAQAHRQRERNIAKEAADERRAATRAQAEFRRRTGSALGAAGRSVVGVGKAALAVTGLAGGALIASRLGGAVDLEHRQRQIIRNARGAGEEGAIAPEALRSKIAAASVTSGVSQEDITGGLESFVQRTGDLQTGIANLQNLTTAAAATGASVTDLAGVAADLSQKFDIKKPQDMADALAVLAFQGKKGAFELRDMANTFPQLAAAAARAGMSGKGGMRLLGGLAQITRSVTGSGEEASTALQMALGQLVAKGSKIESGEAFGGHKAKIFTDKSQTQIGDMRTVLADAITASRGNLPQLEETFDKRGIRAISPLITAYTGASNAAGGGEKGVAAGRAAILKVIDDATNAAGTFKDVQRDASDAMKDTSSQLEILNTRLNAAVQRELLPALLRLGPSIEKLIPLFERGVNALASWVDTLADNPIKGLGELVLLKVGADLAQAGIGIAIKEILLSLITGSAVTKGAAGIVAGAEGIGGALGMGAAGTAAIGAGIAGAGAVGAVGAVGYNAYKLYDENQASGGWMHNLSEAWSGKTARSASGDDYDAMMKKAGITPGQAQMPKSLGDAGTKLVTAADKIAVAADKLGGVSPNRGNSPSPVK